MSQVSNYKSLLDDIFDMKMKFNDMSVTNNCIGALDNKNGFDVFTDNFVKRLKRLKTFYSNSPDTIDEIVKTAKQIGMNRGYKWSGPYSELVALDYFIQFKNVLNIKYIDRGNVDDFEDSIAKRIGKKEIDLDMSFDLQCCRVYSDVKSFIPTHLELVDEILNRLKVKIKKDDYSIAIDQLYEVDYLRTKKDYIYELKNRTLIKELAKCIEEGKSYHRYKLQSGTIAQFKIAYTPSTLVTERSMSPHRLAIDYKYKILDYYDKLLIKKPSFITFVVNPWFNKEMSDFQSFNKDFYRALSRRVFIELTKNHDDMGFYYEELQGKNLEIRDIASLVTGIIFINDHSILKTGGDIYDTYIYINPNAENVVFKSNDFSVLQWTNDVACPFIEDFEHDNY